MRASFLKKLPLFFLLLLPLNAAADSTGGIGVILEYIPATHIHRIKAVFQGSPAAKAKVRAGDQVIAVDGQPTKDMSFQELGKRIRGEVGTPITLTLHQPTLNVTREVKLIRSSSQSVMPLIVQGDSQLNPMSVTLTEKEKDEIKAAIRRLKTPEEHQKMEKLLQELKEGKVLKSDFFKILKAQFPRS